LNPWFALILGYAIGTLQAFAAVLVAWWLFRKRSA
jgi:hypothetical protein